MTTLEDLLEAVRAAEEIEWTTVAAVTLHPAVFADVAWTLRNKATRQLAPASALTGLRVAGVFVHWSGLVRRGEVFVEYRDGRSRTMRLCKEHPR